MKLSIFDLSGKWGAYMQDDKVMTINNIIIKLSLFTIVLKLPLTFCGWAKVIAASQFNK
jgi:hypothetical protein